MLAADRTLLETHLRQSAIKLREKELNLFTENFSSMATQGYYIILSLLYLKVIFIYYI